MRCGDRETRREEKKRQKKQKRPQITGIQGLRDKGEEEAAAGLGLGK
jgi:hypothetical protein